MLSPYIGSFRVTSIQRPDRNINGIIKPHNGIDLVGENKNIYAVTSGKVVISSIINRITGNSAWQFGNRIVILDQKGKYVMYNHLNKRLVFTGQIVKAGQLIGIEGWTGFVVPSGTKGSHLHFEIRDRLGSNYKNFSAAEYLGIPNEIGKYENKGKITITNPFNSSNSCNLEKLKKGDKVEVINTTTIGNTVKGETYTGGKFTIFYKEYEVLSAPTNTDRVVIGIGDTITAAVKECDLRKIKEEG